MQLSDTVLAELCVLPGDPDFESYLPGEQGPVHRMGLPCVTVGSVPAWLAAWIGAPGQTRRALVGGTAGVGPARVPRRA